MVAVQLSHERSHQGKIQLMKYDRWVHAVLTWAMKQTRESVMESRDHVQGQPQCEDIQGEESAKCATVPIGLSCNISKR